MCWGKTRCSFTQEPQQAECRKIRGKLLIYLFWWDFGVSWFKSRSEECPSFEEQWPSVKVQSDAQWPTCFQCKVRIFWQYFWFFSFCLQLLHQNFMISDRKENVHLIMESSLFERLLWKSGQAYFNALCRRLMSVKFVLNPFLISNSPLASWLCISSSSCCFFRWSILLISRYFASPLVIRCTLFPTFLFFFSLLVLSIIIFVISCFVSQVSLCHFDRHNKTWRVDDTYSRKERKDWKEVLEDTILGKRRRDNDQRTTGDDMFTREDND